MGACWVICGSVEMGAGLSLAVLTYVSASVAVLMQEYAKVSKAVLMWVCAGVSGVVLCGCLTTYV